MLCQVQCIPNADCMYLNAQPQVAKTACFVQCNSLYGVVLRSGHDAGLKKEKKKSHPEAGRLGNLK